MKKVVLLRHGQSTWNLENRFTGWTDVGLTELGVAEARRAGDQLREGGFFFDVAFTSYLKRAVDTLNGVLGQLGQEWLPVRKNWRLNEKHYGALQGLNKSETAERYGAAQVQLWRRSYDVAPPPLDENDPRNPKFDPRYRQVPASELPLTESLKTTIERLLPCWEEEIIPAIEKADQVLIVAHGNSLRGIVKYVKRMSDEAIVSLNLPTGVPYVFEFDDAMNLQNDYFLGDPDEVRRLMEAVANQAATR